MYILSAWCCLCAIYWNQVLNGEWRCSWRNADSRCSNYIWVINSLIAYLSASYIRYSTYIYIYIYIYNCDMNCTADGRDGNCRQKRRSRRRHQILFCITVTILVADRRWQNSRTYHLAKCACISFFDLYTVLCCTWLCDYLRGFNLCCIPLLQFQILNLLPIPVIL